MHSRTVDVYFFWGTSVMSRLPMAPPSSTPTPTMTRQPWQRPWSRNALTCEVPKASTTLRQMTALTSGPRSRRPALTGMSSHAQCEPSIVNKPVRKPLREGLLNRGEMGQGPRWGGLVPFRSGENAGCTIFGLRTRRVTLTNSHFCTLLCTRREVQDSTPLHSFAARIKRPPWA